jgi:EAL domain-containing protein (putative c-di-GMP-specific phosphodiesterase class I)
MADKNFAENILLTLPKTRLPGKHLCIEITESSEFNFSSYVMQSIGSLMERDIIVALDYFGTGYSSFQNLKNIPVSLLKTERQFVVDIENNDYLKNLFSIMVQLAHAADMRLVAEGIETESQMKLILESGADYIQGYYYSRPLPANEMAKLISNFK